MYLFPTNCDKINFRQQASLMNIFFLVFMPIRRLDARKIVSLTYPHVYYRTIVF